jgi:hypothetical protein
LLKRSLFILLIFIIGVTAYYQLVKPVPPTLRAVSNTQIKAIGATGAELSATLVFHNPNRISTQLGKLDVDIWLGETQIGSLHEAFTANISKGEDYSYPINIRFAKDEVKLDTATRLRIDGTAGSSVLLANYTLSIHYEGVVPVK